MKQCTKCLKERPIKEYYWDNKDKGYRSSRCKYCVTKHKKKYYKDNKELLIERTRAWANQGRQHVWDYLLEHPCVDCGEEDPIVLEFDHIDPSKKSKGIAVLRGHVSMERLVKEMKKCIVRCSNCHRRKTAAQFGHYQFVQDIYTMPDEDILAQLF